MSNRQLDKFKDLTLGNEKCKSNKGDQSTTPLALGQNILLGKRKASGLCVQSAGSPSNLVENIPPNGFHTHYTHHVCYARVNDNRRDQERERDTV